MMVANYVLQIHIEINFLKNNMSRNDCFLEERLRHRYPQCMGGYPRKLHGVVQRLEFMRGLKMGLEKVAKNMEMSVCQMFVK